MSRSIHGAACLCMLLVVSPAMAEDEGTSLSWSAGIEMTQGTYGGDGDIEDIYVPIQLGLEGKRYSAFLTIPYLSVSAPAEVSIVDPGEEPLPGSGERVTEGGLGDIIAGVTIYDVWYSDKHRLALDLTGKIKFGTADQDRGLGTGATDFTISADLVKFLDQVTLIGTAGYKFRGDPDDMDLENVALASIGGIVRHGERYRSGVFLDYRESSIVGNDDVVELSLFLVRRLRDDRAVQIYVFSGFTDSSADWGVGFRYRGA